MLAGWPTAYKAAPLTGTGAATAVPGESVRELRIALALHVVGDRAGLELATAFDANRNQLTDRTAFAAMVRSVSELLVRGHGRIPPDADRDAHVTAERTYVAWLAGERYEADAAAVTDIAFEPGFFPAKRWREVAENCR